MKKPYKTAIKYHLNDTETEMHHVKNYMLFGIVFYKKTIHKERVKITETVTEETEIKLRYFSKIW